MGHSSAFQLRPLTTNCSINHQITKSPDLRRELGLGDLALTQILFVVGLPWVGVAAKQGPSHVVFWLIAMALFYVPSAIVVIHLNRLMPLEGGLYQWAKLGFNEMTGFLVAWNLWLFAILNTSETGLQITQYAAYIGGARVEGLASNTLVILCVSATIFSGLVWVVIRGLSFGKWVHASGGVLMLATFAMLLAVPWLNVAKGTLPAFHPLATAAPVVSLMSLNLLGKMGFGALGGFEYVAIHAGECRSPVRTIAGSVAIAAPIIAVMFIFGTSSVLALVPQDRIDLIAPIPQVLSIGFNAIGLRSRSRASPSSCWLSSASRRRASCSPATRGCRWWPDGTAFCHRGSRGCTRTTRRRSTRSCSSARSRLRSAHSD